MALFRRFDYSFVLGIYVTETSEILRFYAQWMSEKLLVKYIGVTHGCIFSYLQGNISSFAHKTGAVDISCWLHRGLYGCAYTQAQGGWFCVSQAYHFHVIFNDGWLELHIDNVWIFINILQIMKSLLFSQKPVLFQRAQPTAASTTSTSISNFSNLITSKSFLCLTVLHCRRRR